MGDRISDFFRLFETPTNANRAFEIMRRRKCWPTLHAKMAYGFMRDILR